MISPAKCRHRNTAINRSLPAAIGAYTARTPLGNSPLRSTDSIKTHIKIYVS
jgi:hypothetical protein